MRKQLKQMDRYMRMGLTIFLTAGALLLFYDTLFGDRFILHFFSRFLHAIQPIIIGALIAYLLAPIVNFLEQSFFPRFTKKEPEAGKVSRGARALSLILTWLLIYALLHLFASFLLPELYRSIVQLVNSVEDYYNTIATWVQHLVESNPDVGPIVEQMLDNYYQTFTTWLTENALPQAHQLFYAVSGGIWSTLIFVKDLVVGIIVSCYLLATKERCAAFCRKIAFGLFPRKNVYWTLRGIHKVDHIFSSFVRGKLLDSLIIGVICFVCCYFLKIPYTPLVSVIVGITNVIPFFGPFLGAIPSLFLILLVQPVKALTFLIFIIALQQVDGNIIGPKILGGKTGLSSLWVIIAILIGGSYFGVVGMFFGVPVCACLYAALNFIVDSKLRKKSLPLDVEAYDTDFPEHAAWSARQDGNAPEEDEQP